MKAINLKIDRLRDPIGMQNRMPRLSWNCEGGKEQTAYEYRMIVDGSEVYDSGKMETAQMWTVLPAKAHDRDCVHISLVLWDENGMPGEESTASYEMGISEWKARWIDPELSAMKERRPAAYLKRDFSLDETGRSRLYSTCHGLYEAFIN